MPSRSRIRWCYKDRDGIWHRCYRDRHSGYYYMRCDGRQVVLPEDNTMVPLTCLPCVTRSR